jgi:hypothetical protein
MGEPVPIRPLTIDNPDFFDSCASIYAERNLAVSVGPNMPIEMGELRHVETLFEKQASE